METPEIRQLLATRRRERGSTQAQLDVLAQVSREMILRFEKGDHAIGLRRHKVLRQSLQQGTTLEV